MGFFTAAELQQTKIDVDVDQLEPNCNKCKLDKNSQHPKIEISGEGKRKILIIGEFSSEDEDAYGNAFVGETAFFFKKHLQLSNIILQRDCWKINAVACKPTNVIPSHTQIQCCYPKLQKTILKLQPKVVLLCGPIAITSLFGKDFSNRTVNRWRMYCIPDEKFKCNIVPIHHPEFILGNKRDINAKSQYKRDLKLFGDVLFEKPYIPKLDYESLVTKVTNFLDVKKLLERIIKRRTKIAYDYETTGLKPYRKGHKIVSIGIAVSPTKAFAFPFNYKSFWTMKEFSIIKKLWIKILRSKFIEKITHNWKFEAIWSMELLKSKPACHFDTMMGVHVLDNRAASTGLKFQTFVNFGVRPYDKSIKPFLQAKNGEFNTIEKAPFKDLLTYNGLDCIFTFTLYEKTIPRIVGNKKLLRAYNFFIRGLGVMANMQHTGIAANIKYYTKTEKVLQKKIDKLTQYLTSGREAKSFQKMYHRPIKITSNQDLGKLFYKVLGKPPIYTAKGQFKTDKTTMESLNLPFVNKLLEMKKYEKARGTYLGQFFREIVNDRIHPFFDLHIPISYRGSSSRPNWQNLPKRDPEIGALIRKGITP